VTTTSGETRDTRVEAVAARARDATKDEKNTFV